MKKITQIIFLIFLVLGLFFSPQSVWAIKYELIPPSGDLSRGQEIQFIINIDTESASITSTQIGMTYDTQYLEYLSATPGNAMNSISVTPLGDGKLLFSGTNNSGFSGQGVFAYVNFKIIAGSPGSTELCVLWAPSETPQPTSPPSTPYPTQPTNPPPSGVVGKNNLSKFLGVGFLICAGSLYFLAKNSFYKDYKDRSIEKHHKK